MSFIRLTLQLDLVRVHPSKPKMTKKTSSHEGLYFILIVELNVLYKMDMLSCFIRVKVHLFFTLEKRLFK